MVTASFHLRTTSEMVSKALERDQELLLDHHVASKGATLIDHQRRINLPSQIRHQLLQAH
jgi:hypothetical protein